MSSGVLQVRYMTSCVCFVCFYAPPQPHTYIEGTCLLQIVTIRSGTN